ncbi:MAG: polysaccharide biosynthesis protein GumK [Sphingobium sp.]
MKDTTSAFWDISLRAPAKILILSRHDYRTARRASVHFLAQHMVGKGHAVAFMSIGYSWLSRLRGDSRSVLFSRANRWEDVGGVRAYLWRSAWHPFQLPLPDAAIGWLYRLWASAPCRALDEAAMEADVILVESGITPVLIERLRAHAPHARLIYRATDLLSTAGVPDCIEQMLKQSSDKVDKVVVVARAMIPHFADFPCPTVFIPHGVDGDALRQETPNPYSGARNAVTVGSMLFDPEVIRIAAQANPDFTFHLIGTPHAEFPANVVQYGEKPFRETLPYLQHADLGIAAYQPGPGSAYLADSSLKLMQFNAIGLPALCPHFAVGDRPLRFGYTPGDPGDIARAFDKALGAPRAPLPTEDWQEVAERLVEAALG